MRRKKDRNLPACVYRQHGAYYLVKKNVWTPLGRDLGEAMAEYGRRVSTAQNDGIAALVDAAIASFKVSPQTLTQYEKTGDRLKRIFANFRPEQVKGRDVAKMKAAYVDRPFYGNRLLSLLRLIFSYAVEAQLVESNPCADIKPYKEPARTRYITDTEYAAIYAHAGPRLQVIMDLLYLTAQRPVDILKLRRDQLRDDGIYFEQQKTKARLLVQWSPELREVIERAKNLHGNVKALTVLHNRRGKAPDYSTVKIQWDNARTAAKVDAQLRDIRAKALTDAKQQGLDPQTIAGHSSAAMTKRYLRLRETAIATGPSFRQR